LVNAETVLREFGANYVINFVQLLSTLIILENRLKAKPEHAAIAVIKEYDARERGWGCLSAIKSSLKTTAGHSTVSPALDKEPNSSLKSLYGSKLKLENGNS